MSEKMSGAFDYSEENSKGFQEMTEGQEELSPREKLVKAVEDAQKLVDSSDPEDQSFGATALPKAEADLASFDAENPSERQAA